MINYEGRNRETENYLRTIYFDHPEWTRCLVGLMPATWIKYREELEDIVLAHPRIWPGYRKGSQDFDDVGGNPLYMDGECTDCWGVKWKNIERGLDSMTVGHPLEDWSALDSYTPPDPLKDDMFGPRNWDAIKKGMAESRKQGNLAQGDGLPHGFIYMKLFYLRGFENLMMDLATEDPRLLKIIDMIENYNSVVVNKLIELGAEYMGFGEDLGMQHSLPMSPEMWRRYIKPSYDRIFKPCRDADIPIFLHTDGKITEIIPDLIEVGVKILNPQIRANGLKGLQDTAKGKVALLQDLDRQLFPFASPAQVEDHINEVYEGLYLPEGGLMLYAECEPDIPLENIEAICTTFEKVCNPPEPE